MNNKIVPWWSERSQLEPEKPPISEVPVVEAAGDSVVAGVGTPTPDPTSR